MEPNSQNSQRTPLDETIATLQRTGVFLQEKIAAGVPGAEEAFGHFKKLLISMATAGNAVPPAEPFPVLVPGRTYKIEVFTLQEGRATHRHELDIPADFPEAVQRSLEVIRESHKASGFHPEMKRETTSLGEALQITTYRFPPSTYTYPTASDPVDAIAILVIEATPETLYRLEFGFLEDGEIVHRPEMDFGPASKAATKHHLAGIEQRHAGSEITWEMEFLNGGSDFAQVAIYKTPVDEMRIVVIDVPPAATASKDIAHG